MNLISNKINALKTNIFSKYRSRKSKKTIRLKMRKKFKRRCTNKLKITYFEEKNHLINKLFDRWYADIIGESAAQHSINNRVRQIKEKLKNNFNFYR